MTTPLSARRAPTARPSRRASTLRRRLAVFGGTPRGLATGFAALHLAYVCALLPVILTGGTEGDLPLYREWAQSALAGAWPVRDFDWVYPAGALLPIVAPLVFGPALYQIVWLVMIASANALALTSLAGRRLQRRSGYRAAWYWLSAVLLLAPVSMLRLEGVAAPLAIAGLVWLTRRPVVAGALIAAATWVKVWPAAIAASAVIVSRRRAAVALGGLATSGAIAVAVAAAGGGERLFGFLTIQTDRAPQLEAPVATPWVWATIWDLPGARIRQNAELATREVIGHGAMAAGEVVDVLMIVAFVGIAGLLVLARSRQLPIAPRRALGESQLIVLGSFALTASLIVFNKVGSPQYLLWLAPIVAVGLRIDASRWRPPAIWMSVTCFVTTLVFPIFYMPLVHGDPFAASLLLVRNVLLVGLLAWSVVALWRLTPGRDGARRRQRRRGRARPA